MGAIHFNSVGCQNTISAKQELERPDEFNDGVGGKGGRREGPAELMNHITAFMEIPTASHVLLELGQRAIDLFVPGGANKPQFALHWIV